MAESHLLWQTLKKSTDIKFVICLNLGMPNQPFREAYNAAQGLKVRALIHG
jgi:hypothetical protein